MTLGNDLSNHFESYINITFSDIYMYIQSKGI